MGGPLPAAAPRPVTARSLLGAVAVFAVVGVLGNAPELHRAAAGSDRGHVAAVVVEPAVRAAGTLGAARPRHAAEAVRDALGGTASLPVGAPTGEGPSILLAGDSLVDDLAEPFAAQARVRWAADTYAFAQRGTALGADVLIDWPARIADEVARRDIDVVVVVLAAAPQARAELDETGTDGLEGDARAVAAAALDAGATAVRWVEYPVAADPDVEANDAAEDAAVDRALRDLPAARVETSDVLVTDDGSYARAVEGVTVRADDGLHLTGPGARLFTEAVVDRLDL